MSNWEKGLLLTGAFFEEGLSPENELTFGGREEVDKGEAQGGEKEKLLSQVGEDQGSQNGT